MSLDINDIYEEIKDEGEVIVTYRGVISSELISNTLEEVEAVFIKKNEPTKFIKKAYIILVEALQNLYHHIEMPPDFLENSEKVNKFAIFVFSKINDFAYKLTTGNFVKKSKKHFLKDRLDQINVLTVEELKDLYKNILNNEEFSSKGGGGLGMIDIARKTGNKLNYRFEKYNEDFHFFILEIVLS
jgi:hypothetical protein